MKKQINEDKNKKRKNIKKRKASKKKKNSLFSKIDQCFKELERRIFNDSESNFSLLEVVLIIVISILFGIIIGYLITFSKSGSASDSNIEEIVETYHNIVDDYYDSVDKDKLSEAAIKGMIDSLEDPYSNYMDSNSTDEFNEQIDGSFVGIGVVVMYNEEYNTIIEVYKGSPAEAAGIEKDDVIIKVDGEDVRGVFGDEISKKIRGKEGSVVHISVLRGEEEKEFDVVRGKIDIKSVTSNVIEQDNKKIGYLKIENFAANTYSQFSKELKKIEKKKINSLIIDVRNNPGGHLLQTRQILSLFFNKKTVLYQIQDKSLKKKIYSYTKDTRTYPVVVLVNGGSASASEILAAAIKESYNGYVVGTKTYGKGTVQQVKELSDGSMIKYTTENWLTPNGNWINEVGIEPTNVVNLSEEYIKNPSDETDNQLQEALKLVSK